MSNEILILFLCSLTVSGAYWLVPARLREGFVVLATAGVLILISPASFLWLAGTTLALPVIMGAADRYPHKGRATFMCIALLLVLLLASRELPLAIWIGGSYFTLRHIHVLLEWWSGRQPPVPVWTYVRYQFFLPVLMAGPINRLEHFNRQCDRRIWDPSQFFTGLERTLFGFAQFVVIAGFALVFVDETLQDVLLSAPIFIRELAASFMFWVKLYFAFSGLTEIALGTALMTGLKLEENFNRPWAAPNLIEFWSRWHMTLSSWCRDYVFRPIATHFRSPLLGVIAAMLAIGLWHDTTVYYVLWAFWQSLGIVLTRIAMNSKIGDRLPAFATKAGPFVVMLWLSLTTPVIHLFLNGGPL